MTFAYRYVLPALWLAWAVYWWALSRSVKSTVRHESVASRLAHVVPLMVAFVLLAAPAPRFPFLNARLFPATAASFAVGVLLTAAGLLFAAWARRHIGANW